MVTQRLEPPRRWCLTRRWHITCADVNLKQKIKDAIERTTAGSGITVDIAARGDHFHDDDPDNIVNRLTAGSTNGNGSIQIEQSLQAREEYGVAIADAVADVYRPRL
jgi:phage replication-related protein YjqB (UPF0714/DUF867 family)